MKEPFIIETGIESTVPTKGIIKLRYTPFNNEVGIIAISPVETSKAIYFYTKNLNTFIEKLNQMKEKLKEAGVI